jgi:hypothetical protein
MDDLLIITRGILDNHLEKKETVLTRLHDAGLKVNAAKSSFCAHEIEYLGYIYMSFTYCIFCEVCELWPRSSL